MLTVYKDEEDVQSKPWKSILKLVIRREEVNGFQDGTIQEEKNLSATGYTPRALLGST
jgi:hypothetical protein